MSNEKINDQISKLEAANGNLSLKVDVNKARMRTLVGKIAGVKIGDVVVSKGARYRVVGVLSETVPLRGKPVLSGVKIAKNGNLAKRRVEIKGAWFVEGATPKKPLSKVALPAPGKKRAKLGVVPAKRRGRPSKKSLENYIVLGTA